MLKYLLKVFTLTTIVSLFISVSSFAQKQNCNSCHSDLKPEQIARFQKTHSSNERGLGIMDKGQVANYLGTMEFSQVFMNTLIMRFIGPHPQIMKRNTASD